MSASRDASAHTMQAPAVETFLAEFHDRRPGLTPKAFAGLPVDFQGTARASSYEVLASAVPTRPPDVAVLDLACGDGYLLSLLASRAQPGLVLCGVDLSAGELAAARTRLGQAVSLVQARAQHLPYGSGRFDCVLCHMALMLMDDAGRVLREVRRVLKPGGRFAAIVGAAPPPSAALTLYVEAIKRQTRQAQWTAVRFGDGRLRTTEGIAELFGAQRFSSLVTEDLQIAMRLGPPEIWLRLLDMYDLYLLGDAERLSVEREFHEEATAASGPDGKLDFPIALRYLGALAS